MASLTLQTLANEYIAQGLTTGNVVSDDVVLKQAIDAVRFYLAYASLEYTLVGDIEVGIGDVAATTEVSASEWGIIKPLFLFYVEYQNSLILESSRAMGLDVYGRSSSEVKGSIEAYEAELPHKAFNQDMFTASQDGYGGDSDPMMVGSYGYRVVFIV